MMIRKRDGTRARYDESKARLAAERAGVGTGDAAAIAAGVTRRARPPLTVAKVGGLTEEAVLRAGLHEACRR